MLELERGEDIDTVQKALFSNEEEQARLLEQIKHREENLTIRSPEAVETMASFYEHLLTNPTLDLRVRYLTNAKIGIERPSYMPKRVPAILVWNQIHGNELKIDDQAGALAGMRRLLNNVSKPEGLNDETWKAFAAFIAAATDDDLLGFIRRVEWTTEITPSESLRTTIQQALISMHGALPNTVEAIYERLFFCVFRVLSRPGRKQLSLADLQEQLALPALSAADQQLSGNLRVLLLEIEGRVAVLEEGFKQHEQTIQQIDSQLQALAQQIGVNVAVDYTFALPQLDMPPLAEPGVRRQEAVSHYIDLFKRKAWCALYGEIGRGKTCLARLIAGASPNPAWIRLDGLDGDKACIRIDEALAALSGREPTPYRETWYDNICAELAPGTMIVLENLPRMTGNDLLSERCIMLARICAHRNIKILSSSAYDLPPQVRQALGEDLLLSEEAPSFTDQEIRDLFAAYGATEHFISGRGVEWVTLLTQQNATLLVAAARYLASHNWELGTQAFDGIVRGGYAQEVNEQTRLLLRETVPDEQDRELLYRLNLIRAAFTENDVRRVSEVPPVITFPRERLATAVGLWVQRDTANTYTTSPLLNQLGGEDLETSVSRNVHLELGEAILAKRLLGPSDVFDAVSHFHLGEAFDRAGVVLLKALMAIQHDDNVKDDWGISGLWHGLPLPDQMDLNLRLMIRACQIAVRHKLGKSVEYPVDDLDRLIEHATDQNAAWVVGAAVMVGPSWVSENPVRANRYLLKALRAFPEAVLRDGNRLTFPVDAPLESLIWLNAYGIRSVEELRDWLSTVEQMTPEGRRATQECEIGQHGCLFVATSLWLVELAKPAPERQWDVVLSALEDLSTRAKDLDFELLWARSINVRIRILGQYKDSLDVAQVLAMEAIALASDDPTVRFVIQEGIAFQLALANRLNEALPWLRAALAERTEAYAFERLTALLQAGRAVAEDDAKLALRYTSEAVQLAETSPEISETDFVRALGEHAIALWLSGDLAGAYLPLQNAVARLLAVEKRDDEWKTVAVLLAHVLVYLSNLAKYGRPPEFARGGHPYEAPFQGNLLIYRPEVIDHYLEAHNSYLPGSLVSFAEGIGKNEEASKWAIRAFDIASELGDTNSKSTLGMLALGYLILNDRFVEALDVARDLGVDAVAVNIIGSSSKDHLLPGFDAGSVLGDSNERWQEAEYYATLVGLVPVMFRLATIRLDNPERARDAAKLAAKACREISQDAFTPDLWNSAAELLEQIFTEDIDSEGLVARGKGFDVKQQVALRAICYIGASLESEPQLAVQIHLAILPFLSDHLQPFVSIYRQALVPFVETFWLRTFQESRFRFTNPREIQSQLEHTVSTRGEGFVQCLLKIISTGLRVPIDDSTRRWLDQQ